MDLDPEQIATQFFLLSLVLSLFVFFTMHLSKVSMTTYPKSSGITLDFLYTLYDTLR